MASVSGKTVKSSSITFVPDEFLPAIGLVMVTHAFMDNKLQQAICYIGGLDYTVGVSFLSEVEMTARRAGIFKNLARVKEQNLNQMAKMIILGEMVVKLSEERNIIAHQVPYWVGANNSEIGYFKEINKTRPQIKVQAPYIATIESLVSLARKMESIAIHLGMITPHYLPEGTDIKGKTAEEVRDLLIADPRWTDDTYFPWPDKLKKKIENLRNQPQIGKSESKPSDP
jgi:hypothetical protein